MIGHENVIHILENYKSIIAPVNPAKPSVTFKDQYTATIGDVEAVAYYWGKSHTEADIAIYFPDQKSVAVGDILYMSGEVAIDGPDGNGSIFGMLERIDDLLKLDFEIAIPGHGDNVFTYEEVVLYQDRLGELIRRGQQAIREGVSQEDWVKSVDIYDLGFRFKGHFWYSQKHLAPVYQELSQSAAAN